MGLVAKDDGWRIPDELWAEMERLLPARSPHPLGCHNPRVPDRDAMNSILFVLRTDCRWNALDATGMGSCSSAYRRFREWTVAGVFPEFWRRRLLAFDSVKGRLLAEPLPPAARPLGKAGDKYLAMLHLACGLVTWRAAGLFAREKRLSKALSSGVARSAGNATPRGRGLRGKPAVSPVSQPPVMAVMTSTRERASSGVSSFARSRST